MRWYTRRDSSSVEKGPFDEDALRSSLARGDVKRSTLLRREDEQEWLALDKHPRFTIQEPPASAPPGGSCYDGATEAVLKVDRASEALWALAAGSFILFMFHNVVNVLGAPKRSVGTDAAAYTAASLAGNVFGSLLLVFGISWIVVQFRKGRTQRIKVQTFFITCTALEGVRLLSMLSIGATQRYVEKARLAEEAKGADTAP